MFCPNCGHEIEEGVKFCPYCGASLSSPNEAASVSNHQDGAVDNDNNAKIPVNTPNTSVVSETPTTSVVSETPTTSVVSETPTTSVVSETPTTSVISETPTPTQSYNQPTYVNQTSSVVNNSIPQRTKGGSRNTAAGILYILGGALLLIDGFRSFGLDWGLISLAAGIGMLVVGILQFTKVKPRVSSIIKIVFGVLTLGISFLCVVGFDWTYVGLLGGFLMLISGILGLFKISPIIVSVIEIILAGILLIFGFLCLGFVWGDTALAISIPILVCAILRLVHRDKENSATAVIDEQKSVEKRTPLIIIGIVIAVLIIIILIVLLSSRSGNSDNTPQNDDQDIVEEEIIPTESTPAIEEEPNDVKIETTEAVKETTGKSKSNIDIVGTLINTAEESTFQFTLTDDQENFINSHLNLFPAEKEDFEELAGLYDDTLDYAHVIKNPQRYTGSFVFIPDLLVIQAWEDSLQSSVTNEYDNFTGFNVMDRNGNFYVIYYVGKSVDAVEGDHIATFATPLDYITYQDASGNNIFSLIMMGSIVENNNSPVLLNNFLENYIVSDTETFTEEDTESIVEETDTDDSASSNDYILPDSDSRYYTADELSRLTKDELRIARNEIYARHGRIFDSADLDEYFRSKSWYEPTIPASQFDDRVFNDYEKKNAELIRTVENS